MNAALNAAPRGAGSPSPCGDVALSSSAQRRSRFEELKVEVLKLTASQKQQIVLLLQPSQEQAETGLAATNVSKMYDAMASTLLDLTGASSAPFETRMRHQGASIKKACAAIDAYLDRHLTQEGVLSVRDRYAAYRLVMTTTYSYMIALDIPVTITTMLQQVENVGRVMDAAFPGYAAAGCIAAVFKASREGASMHA